MVKFDLKRLKGKEVAVHCVTEEQAQDFVNWVCSLGKENDFITNWKIEKKESCYCLDESLLFGYGRKSSYINYGYKVISYEEALLKENKNNYIENQNVKAHYKNQKIDTFARCKANMKLQSQKDICIFNIDKYLHREKGQNLSDIKKIRDYLDWLEEIEKRIEK